MYVAISDRDRTIAPQMPQTTWLQGFGFGARVEELHELERWVPQELLARMEGYRALKRAHKELATDLAALEETVSAQAATLTSQASTLASQASTLASQASTIAVQAKAIETLTRRWTRTLSLSPLIHSQIEQKAARQ